MKECSYQEGIHREREREREEEKLDRRRSATERSVHIFCSVYQNHACK